MEGDMKLEGIEVEDANTDLLLNIRDTDTKTGQRDPANCAAAKASCRIRGVEEARVFRARVYLKFTKASGKKVWRRYLTPDALRGEIIAMDRGGQFEPDDYLLKAPMKSTRLGAYKPTGPRSGRRPSRRKPPAHVVKNIRPYGPSGWGRHGY
jgi:hypothetical protein